MHTYNYVQLTAHDHGHDEQGLHRYALDHLCSFGPGVIRHQVTLEITYVSNPLKRPGVPDFSGSKYQNGENIPMAIKYTKWQ
jgi:hypothetical protein